MSDHVLDSFALIAYLEREKGFATVAKLFTEAMEGECEISMTTVNAGEVLYIILRECGREKLRESERLIATLPITMVDADMALAREAAHLKAFKKMSFADCFAAALAKRNGAVLVTGDAEFREMEKEIKIEWL
jgi:predicted nucleic acid-binding protein